MKSAQTLHIEMCVSRNCVGLYSLPGAGQVQIPVALIVPECVRACVRASVSVSVSVSARGRVRARLFVCGIDASEGVKLTCGQQHLYPPEQS
jgi:hypothetical protein